MGERQPKLSAPLLYFSQDIIMEKTLSEFQYCPTPSTSPILNVPQLEIKSVSKHPWQSPKKARRENEARWPMNMAFPSFPSYFIESVCVFFQVLGRFPINYPQLSHPPFLPND